MLVCDGLSNGLRTHAFLRANLRHRQRANTDGRGQPVECRPNDNGNSQRNGNQRATYNDFLINEQVNHRYGSNYVCSWRPINCKQCFGTCWRSTCARSRSKRPGSGKLDMLHTARLPFEWMARQKCSAFWANLKRARLLFERGKIKRITSSQAYQALFMRAAYSNGFIRSNVV